MAVDIKQLRIGAHVEVNGVRARVIELVEKHLHNEPWAMYAATIDGEYRTCGGFLQDAEPIAITPELLVELGFEIYSGSQIRINERMRSVTLSPLDNGEWHVRHITPTYKWQSLIVRHLNELENFIYLTLGKELIEE